MAHTKSMFNKHTLDDSQFPILCETCLGDNPCMRMMVDRHGQECKICNRPFVTYRWCPGKRMRYKRTEICRICSKAKNVCQTCLLDLKYNLPVQARDSLLQISNDIPRSDVNREYHAQILEQKYGGPDGGSDQVDGLAAPTEVAAISAGPSAANSELALQATSSSSLVVHESGKDTSAGAQKLAKLARKAPYYKRNMAHICSFFVKGNCNRGDSCPFRHEQPTDPDNPLSKQNIKDR